MERLESIEGNFWRSFVGISMGRWVSRIPSRGSSNSTTRFMLPYRNQSFCLCFVFCLFVCFSLHETEAYTAKFR